MSRQIGLRDDISGLVVNYRCFLFEKIVVVYTEEERGSLLLEALETTSVITAVAAR